MIRHVTGDDIFIDGKSFHPMYGSVSKAEAIQKAETCRKRTGHGSCLGARVIHRERGMSCRIEKTELRGNARWVPFRGWVVYLRFW